MAVVGMRRCMYAHEARKGLQVQIFEIELDDLGEADPSKSYSEEEAILEPAESLSSQMHREEEAHRAAAALSAAPATAEDYKLTK